MPEPNPFLGCRSLRYSFVRPELFRTQLRAILRAAAEGQVLLMFPMISSVSELRRAKAIVEQVQEELRRERIPFGSDIRIGAMVEIPSAAVASPNGPKPRILRAISTDWTTPSRSSDVIRAVRSARGRNMAS